MKPTTAQKEALARLLIYIDHNHPGFSDMVARKTGASSSGLGAMNGLDGGISDLLTKFFGNDDEFIPGSDDFVGPLPQSGFQTPPLVPESSGNWFSSIIETAKEIVPVVFKAQEQKRWADVQFERAKQGLEPLPTQGFSAPPILIDVGAQPGALTRALGYKSSPDLLLWGSVAAVGAFFLFKK